MRRKLNNEIGSFGNSFVDVFANSFGGLAFILVIVVMLLRMNGKPPPAINTERLPDAYHEVEYEIWLAAGFYYWHVIDGELPEGLTLIPENGHLSGTPILTDNNLDKEVYEFTISVISESSKKSHPMKKTYELVVYNRDFYKLEITTFDELPIALKGASYPLTFSASGGKPPYFWHLPVNPLQGLSLSPDGILRGKVESEPGQYNIVAGVRDEAGNVAQKKFKLTVLSEPEEPITPPPLKIKTDTIPDAIANQRYRLTMAGEGGYHPYTWSSEIDDNSFSIDKDGHFLGMPRKKSQLSFTVTMSDAQNNTISKDFILNILPPQLEIKPLLILTPDALPDAIAGNKYVVSLAAFGGLPPYKWTLKSNISALHVDQKGILKAEFSNPADYVINVQLEDALNERVNKDISIKVLPAQYPLTITSDEVPYAVSGFRYSLALSAIGGAPPYQWKLIDSELPDGLSLNDDGIVSGIPNEPYQGSFQIQVADQLNNQDIKTIGIEVLESGEGAIVHKLDLLTNTLPVFLTNDSIDMHLAIKGGGLPYKWTIDGELPDGVAFNNGHLIGKIGKKSASDFSVSISDISGQSVTRFFEMNVKQMVNANWLKIALITMLGAGILLLLFLYFWTIIRKSKKMPLQILTRYIPNARVSAFYSVQLAATGGIAPYKWEIVEGVLPTGLELSEDGIISGTPLEKGELTESKEYNIKIKVTDRALNYHEQIL